MSKPIVAILAIVGGILLASMIGLNSTLASYTNPLIASWLAHGIGALTAVTLLAIFAFKRKSALVNKSKIKAPKWAYWGGIPGAFIVALAAITVNSELGLTGTLTMAIVGQTIFGILCDHFGWFGLKKRLLYRKDYISVLLTISGSLLIISS